MANNNIVLNKPAQASSYVMPYSPSRAVDGSIMPVQRWLSNTVPCWMMIDTGNLFWVNRWVVVQMPQAGWRAPDYNNTALTLQASTDDSNWTTIDSVNGSSSSSIDRTFPPVQGRFFRVVISGGLVTNPHLASILEFALYDTTDPSSEYLSNLQLSSGTLSPAFNKTTTSYTASVDNSTSSITVTPTAEDASATIKVNGSTVASGQASAAIPLTVGSTTNISIVVTSASGAQKNYSVAVTRHTSAYLSNLVVKMGSSTVSLTPSFSSTNLGTYTASVPTPIIFIYPTTEDSAATLVVTCNGTVLTYSGSNYRATLSPGVNNINIKVTSTTGDVKNYILTITKT